MEDFPAKRIRVARTFNHPDWENGVTIAQIVDWMNDNDVPTDAKMQYEGCGTHRIEFEWTEDVHDD